MSGLRCWTRAILLLFSLFHTCLPIASQQAAPTTSGSNKQNDAANDLQSRQEVQNPKEPVENENDKSNPSLVFSRGIVLPDGWVAPAEEAVPASVPGTVTTATPDRDSNPIPSPDSTEPETPAPVPKGPASASPPSPLIFGGREDEVAHRAWRYLIASREPATGLYDSVIHYPATTMWDVGSSMAALVAAERLDLLSPTSFRLQMQQLLNSLAKMPLYNHELPNREYNVRTLIMLDHRSLPSETGSGWSALDVARVLIWMRIVSIWYPEMKPICERIVARWDFRRLRLNGEANGTLVENGKEYIRQEGRLGYEQYAAKGFGLWGIHLPKASAYAHSKPVSILGVDLSQDDRAHSFLTGEPFFLAQMEMGSIDPVFDELSSAVFSVEKRRWEETGVLTAISEDSVSLEPWFVYNTILYNGTEWECVSAGGKPYPKLKGLSTKAAFAYAALTDDSYGLKLEQVAETLVHPLYGFYAGKYDQGGINSSLNLNTNAIVLEAMLYRKRGRRAFLQAAEATSGNEMRVEIAIH